MNPLAQIVRLTRFFTFTLLMRTRKLADSFITRTAAPRLPQPVLNVSEQIRRPRACRICLVRSPCDRRSCYIAARPVIALNTRRGCFMTKTPVCLSFVGLLLLSTGAHANVFDDIWNVVTDPLKLKRGTDTAYKIIIEARQLEKEAKTDIADIESKANTDVHDRLTELRSIYIDAESKTVGDATDLETKTAEDLAALEKKTADDANNLVWNAKCAVVSVLRKNLQESLSKSLEELSDARPTITLLGPPIVRYVSKQVDIDDPSNLYYAAKTTLLNNVAPGKLEDPSANASAYDVYNAYQNIELMAKETRCFLLGSL